MVGGAATPPPPRPHPVVPLARESLWEQDAAAERECRERHGLLAPRTVHRDRRAPTGAIVLHQCDVQDLTGPEAAQAYVQGVRAANVLDLIDHQRRRVVGWAPAARVR